MFHELDTVVLTRDLAEHGLRAGDIGAIVHCHGDTAYEVEFVAADGSTIALLTLSPSDIRTMEATEILHARNVRGRVA
jgi:hypothetical protein